MHRLVIAFATALIGIVLSIAPNPAHAQGFQQQMQDAFGSMTSVTNPQVVLGSTRGVVTGGNFTVKNKVITADLITLTPPRIKMGCGGWDIFGGAFSFISSEQIVAMLRSIAASAVAYAFKLALCTISDDICNGLENLWKDNVFSNFMGKNSCEMGQALVDSFKGGFGTSANQAAGNEKTSSGESDDSTEAENNMKDDSPAVEQAKDHAAETDPEIKYAIVKGNQVWQALKRQDAQNWGSFGGTEFMEDVMSVTGTVIVCAPSVNGCPSSGGGAISGQQDVLMLTRAPIMGLSELVKGRLDYSKVKLWKCNETDECLNPIETSRSNFKGTEELIRVALLGPNQLPGEGLIGKYASNSGTWTTQEKGLITAGGAFVGMALNLAVHNEQDARDFVDAFAEIIAADITYRIVNESLGKTSAAISVLEAGGAVEAQKMVDQARKNLNEEIKRFHSNNMVNTSKWQYYQGVLAARPPVRMPAIAVGSGR